MSRLFNVCVTLTKISGINVDNQIFPGLWQAESENEAIGMAVTQAMGKYPGHSMDNKPHAVDVTDEVRSWARNHPT